MPVKHNPYPPVHPRLSSWEKCLRLLNCLNNDIPFKTYPPPKKKEEKLKSMCTKKKQKAKRKWYKWYKWYTDSVAI